MNETEMDNQITQHAEEGDDRSMHTVTVLSNDLRVANFSSAHSFTFTDGSIVPAVSGACATRLAMIAIETRMWPKKLFGSDVFHEKIQHIKLEFKISEPVLTEILYWLNQYDNDLIDIVIVPLPVITLMKNVFRWKEDDMLMSPFRTIRMSDRISKKCLIDKFCI